MPTSIKTQVLEGLTAALATASSLVSVNRFPPTGIILDTIVGPAAYIHEAGPERRGTNNRFAVGVLELDIVVFIELQSLDVENGNLTFLDTADNIQAQIHNILFGPGHPELGGLAIKIVEQIVEKQIPSDQWGALIYTVEVTYQHFTADAFRRS